MRFAMTVADTIAMLHTQSITRGSFRVTLGYQSPLGATGGKTLASIYRVGRMAFAHCAQRYLFRERPAVLLWLALCTAYSRMVI